MAWKGHPSFLRQILVILLDRFWMGALGKIASVPRWFFSSSLVLKDATVTQEFEPRRVMASLEQLASLDSMEGITQAEVSPPTPFFERFVGGKLIYAVYPGVLVALTIALASTWLSEEYNAPVMLFALLFGMSFHFLSEEGRCVAGIEFAARNVLRFGVALLGARITVGQIAELGVGPVVMVLGGVATTIAIGWGLSRVLKLKSAFGVLSGGAVAICGASAALAIASVLPRSDAAERDTILTVVSVTALSTLAMVLYPAFVTVFGLSNGDAGIFLGGTIHDVAQVIGAGYMVSEETGDISTIIKLLRVATLVPVVLVIAVVVSRMSLQKSSSRPPFPLFLLGFAAIVSVNSTGVVPSEILDGLVTVSRWCLVTAIAALGMKTSFKALLQVGWRPVGLLVGETIWIALFVLTAILFIL